MFALLEEYLKKNYVQEEKVPEAPQKCEILFQITLDPIQDFDDLGEYVNEQKDSFSQYLIDLIKAHGMENADVYKAANLDRQYFSKLISESIKPSKEKLLLIAVAMKLNITESSEMLSKAGYSFSTCSKSDLIFKFHIEREDFDMDSIYKAHVYFDAGVKMFGDFN